MAGAMKGTADSDKGLPAFDTIAAAVSGDEEALSNVLRHYDRLITTLSSEAVFDPDGTQRTQINGELKAQIQNRLRGRIHRKIPFWAISSAKSCAKRDFRRKPSFACRLGKRLVPDFYEIVEIRNFLWMNRCKSPLKV